VDEHGSEARTHSREKDCHEKEKEIFPVVCIDQKKKNARPYCPRPQAGLKLSLLTA
jgi:hypothetical protein